MRSKIARLLTVVAAALIVAVVATTCASTEGSTSEETVAIRDTPFSAEVQVASPDGQLRVELGLDEVGRPSYRVVRTVEGVDTLTIEDSTLGLELTVDDLAVSLASGATTVAAGDADVIVDHFSLPTGKARESTVEARRQRVDFGGFDSGVVLTVDVWVDNGAVALRYDVQTPGQTIRVEWERTSFSIPSGSRSWLQPHDGATRYTPAYERLRSGATPADRPGRSPFGWTFPSLFETGGQWTLITEANLEDGAAASHLSPVVEDGEYFVDLAHRDEGNGIGDPRPIALQRWTSPWRAIITGSDLAHIVESNHVRHLARPSTEGSDFSWVQPGRVSWSWWSAHDSSRDPEAMRPFIDLAAELGWEYSLVDANWNTFDDSELVSLIEYARERNVGLMLWYNSGGPHNAVTEAPRNRMTDPDARRAEFARLVELGVVGVKVDFFHSDKPMHIQLYRDILHDAAEANLLVNFHGSTVPRGWEREFPNLMTMEAVRGAEIYTFDGSYAAAAPRQNTTLVFTRNVVGPMDYTPTILGNTVRRFTTNGHELALAVVFESPLQHFADTPAAYLSSPDTVIEFLREVPTAWDETRLVSGHPEEHAVIARRAGDTWWLGAINGTNESLPIVIDPSLLGIEEGAAMTLVCDNPDWEGRPGSNAGWDDPAQYRIIETSAERTSIDLVPFGGCLIRID